MTRLYGAYVLAILVGMLFGLASKGAAIQRHRESHDDMKLTAARRRKQASVAEQETVCVSVAVYEETTYVDGLLKNFFYFAEPSSRLVLHLDSRTNYTKDQIKAWESDRVAITEERVAVDPFMGSILWAIILNARTMHKQWTDQSKGGACAYLVYQASNMMWVRRGFESEVRQRRYGSFHQLPEQNHGSCSSGHSITKKLTKPRKIYGWGQPEGSFYPMSMMIDFLKIARVTRKKNQKKIMKIRCFLEAFSLQTYALNYEPIFQDDEIASEYKLSRSLSWNHVTYGNKEGDSVPLDEIIAISRGEPGWEPYYAVKRVNRNVSHPITQYILSLAR